MTKENMEANIVSAPQRNPASGPRQTPAMITMAQTGFTAGTIKNAARPTTAIAAKTAMTTNSLASGCAVQDHKEGDHRFNNDHHTDKVVLTIVHEENAKSNGCRNNQ